MLSTVGSAMLGARDDSCEEECSESLADKLIAESGATFHMTRSADLASKVQLCGRKDRIEVNHLIDLVRYRMLTVVFPAYLDC